VIGVDLAPKSDQIEQGDLAHLRFPDQAFDTVYNSEVIEHLAPEVAQTILRELVRVLAPGGHLVLTTPFDEDLRSQLVTCPGCKTEFHRWGHQQTFRAADFENLARELGLEPVSIAPVRLARIRKLALVGPRLLRSALGRRLVRGRKNAGNRTLVMLARKP